MPFTPFHFGPGLVFNAAAPRQANWLTFCVANIIIDLEPAYYILTQDPPLHRSMHSMGGTTVVFGATVLVWVGVRRMALDKAIPNWWDWQGQQWRAA